MKIYHILITTVISSVVVSCSEQSPKPQIVVKNNRNVARSFETVAIDLNLLKDIDNNDRIVLKEASNGEILPSQLDDTNGDGINDVLLFQPEIDAQSENVYEINITNATELTEEDPTCYSRFVPERTDDYAWENDRVAFRTYGPVAQKMKEEGIPGGTLSSGIDAWLKRVDYPVINRWYKKELETDGSYHHDDGEGLDNFHVGVSRGVGGIAVKTDSSYHFSKNFISWERISTGPIRTSFILKYENWDAAGKTISEQKKISLDRGSNLSKFEVTLHGTDTISAGLTLHEMDGTQTTNIPNGWISYWQPHGDSELGTGIVVPENRMTGYEYYVSKRKDESNLYAHIVTKENTAVYYAGFGWKKSEQFHSQTEWEEYLAEFAENLKNPLQVTLK